MGAQDHALPAPLDLNHKHGMGAFRMDQPGNTVSTNPCRYFTGAIRSFCQCSGGCRCSHGGIILARALDRKIKSAYRIAAPDWLIRLLACDSQPPPAALSVSIQISPAPGFLLLLLSIYSQRLSTKHSTLFKLSPHLIKQLLKPHFTMTGRK